MPMRPPMPMAQAPMIQPEAAAPAKRPFQDFKWFDQAPTLDSTDPNAPVFTPGRPGGLSAIGQALSGIAAPFVGDMEFALKQQQLRQKAEEADMEFQKYLVGMGRSKFIFTTDETGRPVMIGDIGRGNQYVSPTMTMTPEDRTNREATAASRKKLNDALPNVASTLSAFDDLERLSNDLPDFKPGAYQQTKAKVKTGLGVYSADKKYTDYDAALAKAFAPTTRSILTEVGTLNEGDIDRSAKTLGKMELPKANKLENIKNLKKQLMAGLDQRLKSAGISWDDIKTSNPELYNKIFPKQISASEFQEFNVGGTMYKIPSDKVDAFKKAKGLK